MGVSGTCPKCGKKWSGTAKDAFGFVVTDCGECQLKKQKEVTDRFKGIATKKTSS